MPLFLKTFIIACSISMAIPPASCGQCSGSRECGRYSNSYMCMATGLALGMPSPDEFSLMMSRHVMSPTGIPITLHVNDVFSGNRFKALYYSALSHDAENKLPPLRITPSYSPPLWQIIGYAVLEIIAYKNRY